MAAISVQEDGGGDYTSLEAAVENASTGDGDVITITETWNATTGDEDTQIAVTDALTMQATGSSKHIGRPWASGETTFRHRNTSSGHSFTITDTGSVTFIGLDIQNESTGTSDEVFRNNVANTFLAQNCVLGFASRNNEQDVFYTETTTDATFEQCHFYNVMRGCLDLTGSASGTVNINSCTGYDIGFSDSQTSRSGLVGKNTSGTMTINIYNTICHMNSVNYNVCTNSTTANTTGNIERLITNSTVVPMQNAPATENYANNVEDAVINDTDSSGNYILLDTTTSPYDLRLFDNATNNAAQDVHATATAANLTIPSTDIVGTSRPQNTNFDLGAFEVPVGGASTLVADSGSYAYTGTAAELQRGLIVAADSGSYVYTGTTTALDRGFTLTANSGSYAYTGTAATLTFTPTGDFDLIANSGAYVYSGTVVSLLVGRNLVANSGSYTYTGTAANLQRGLVMAAASGSYVYTGTNAGLLRGLVLGAGRGSYVYNGTTVSLSSTAQVWTIQADSVTIWSSQADSSTTWSEQIDSTTTWTAQ